MILAVLDANVIVTELAYFSLVAPGRLRLDVVRGDPADNRYVEAAVEAEAGYIVTGDRLLLAHVL